MDDDTLPTGVHVHGKAIGVTGAGGHLGRAMTLALVGAGATVLACGRRPDPLEDTKAAAEAVGLGDRVIVAPADVGNPDDLERVLDRLQAEAGGVDGWVNNAYAGESDPFGAMDAERVRRTITAGLVNVMMATQAVAARMRPRRRGSIVNVGSMYGSVSPQPGAYASFPEHHNPPDYGAAKAGVLQFTRYAACHLAADGIRVNALSPGAFPSPAVQAHGEFVRALESRVPMGRLGRPEELGGPLVLLLSDAASYLTGHNLVVDGGWTAW